MDLTIRPFESGDEAAVVALWERCKLVVLWNDPHRDIALKLAVQPKNLLVGLIEDCVVATVMIGYDGHRGWINYLGVSPDHRRQGLGRRMMEEAESRLRSLNCPKINLQVRATNAAVVAFYEALGYKVDEVVSMGKRLG